MEGIQATQASARGALDSRGSNLECRGSAGSNTPMVINRDQGLQQGVRQDEEVDSARRRARVVVEMEDALMRGDGFDPGTGSDVEGQLIEGGTEGLGDRIVSSLETMESSTPVTRQGWNSGASEDVVEINKSGGSKIDFFAIDAALEDDPQCTPVPLSADLRGREHKTTPFPQSGGHQNSVASSTAVKPLSSWCENNVIHEVDEDSREGMGTPPNQRQKTLTPVPATVPVHNGLQFHGPSGILSSDGSLNTYHTPLDDWSPSCPSTVVLDSPASMVPDAPSALGQEQFTPSRASDPLRQSIRRYIHFVWHSVRLGCWTISCSLLYYWLLLKIHMNQCASIDDTPWDAWHRNVENTS